MGVAVYNCGNNENNGGAIVLVKIFSSRSFVIQMWMTWNFTVSSLFKNTSVIKFS